MRMITLRGVNPLAFSFSDGPDRIAGHMPASKFNPIWSQRADSFLSNPPNRKFTDWNLTTRIILPSKAAGDPRYNNYSFRCVHTRPGTATTRWTESAS